MGQQYKKGVDKAADEESHKTFETGNNELPANMSSKHGDNKAKNSLAGPSKNTTKKQRPVVGSVGSLAMSGTTARKEFQRLQQIQLELHAWL